MRATDERGMQYTGQNNVIDKARAASQQRMVLKPQNPGSDPVAHWPSLAIAFLARSMTSVGVL